MKKSHSSRSHKQLLGALAAVSNLGASAFNKKDRDYLKKGQVLRLPKRASAAQLRAYQLALMFAERARGISDTSLSASDRAGIEKVVASFVAGKRAKYTPDDAVNDFTVETDSEKLKIAGLVVGKRQGYDNSYINVCPHQLITGKSSDGLTVSGQTSEIDAARGRYAARVMLHLLDTGVTTRAIDNVSSAITGQKEKQHYLFLGPEGAGGEARLKLDRNVCYNVRLSKNIIEAARINSVYAGFSKATEADRQFVDDAVSNTSFQDMPGARTRRGVNGLAGSELSEHLGAMKRRRRKAKKSSSKRPARKSARRVSRRKRK